MEWRPVLGYEGFYEISDSGLVRSLDRISSTTGKLREGKTLKIHLHEGYPSVNLTTDEKHQCVRVHALLIKAFVCGRPEGQECRHLDGVRTNIDLSNLRWGTKSQNHLDRIAHGRNNLQHLMGQDHPTSKLTNEDVMRLRSERAFKSILQLVKENPQWSRFAIWASVTGFTWAHLPGAVPSNRKCKKSDYYK